VKDSFASSAFPNDPNMTKKMMSTIKTIYLTRWLEYITPVPGGPNNPEAGRRGYRKNTPNPGLNGTGESASAPDNRGEEGESVDISGDKRKSKEMDVDVDKEKRGGTQPVGRVKRRYVFKKHAEPTSSVQPALKKHGRRQKFPAPDANSNNNRGNRFSNFMNGGTNNTNRGKKSNHNNSDDENGFSSRKDSHGSKGSAGAGGGTGNIYTGGTITGPYQLLQGGCTSWVAGEGAIHSRYIYIYIYICIIFHLCFYCII
jgi:hypothetical protein